MTNSFNFDAIDRRTRRITPDLIDAVRDRIVYGIQPDQIYLFGSQAAGHATTESDIDLLVIVDNQHVLAPLQHRFRAGKVMDLFRYRSFGLDTIVLTDEEVEHLQSVNEGEWDLVLDILETGRLLYERGEEAATQRTYSSANTRMVSESRARISISQNRTIRD